MRSLTEIYSEFPRFPTRICLQNRFKRSVFVFPCGMIDPDLLRKMGAVSDGATLDVKTQSAATSE